MRSSRISARTVAAAVAASALLAATPTVAPAASEPAATGVACKALSSKGLKAVLRKVMSRYSDQRTPLPGKVLFGRCGTRYYAAAYFNFPLTGPTDQPEKFTRRRGGPWRLIGDSGDPILYGIPRALRNKWGLQ